MSATGVRLLRVGQIVPSSNTTMETEVPALLRRAAAADAVEFTFHSSRARMRTVSSDELLAMNRQIYRCAEELADARMDVVVSACLVATMCQGPGAHRDTETALRKACAVGSPRAVAVTSAGALVDGLHALGARRIAMITPYVQSLTDAVVRYLGDEGIEVVDVLSLGIPDNVAVGALDPLAPAALVDRLRVDEADAVVLSACVQMPSLPALGVVQRRLPVPVLSTASATAFQILKGLGLETTVPEAGDLLSGRYG